MILSLIAAVGRNNELGKGNELLWRMPADMKHFKTTTTGHTVIMGRKTFESFPNGALPNRRNIVITRDPNYAKENVEVVHSLEEALQLAALEQGRKFEENDEEVEIFVIGGGDLYAQAIKKANKLYITHLDVTDHADTFFPTIGPEWQEVSREEHSADETNPFPYAFVVYRK